MSSRSPEPPAALLVTLLLASAFTSCAGGAQRPTPRPTPQQAQHARPPGVLRVCADPNNLPFSNRRLEGFENKIAALVARELNAAVEYTWRAQRRGFIRETLRAGACDVVVGMPSSLELALTTALISEGIYLSDRLNREVSADEIREQSVSTALPG
jgi:ABC-type amino acid transport substrate-binding protein